MSTTQLFIALASLFITVIVAQVATIKWYVDARFNAIDGQLKFLIDHVVTHGERIASLEAKVK